MQQCPGSDDRQGQARRQCLQITGPVRKQHHQARADQAEPGGNAQGGCDHGALLAEKFAQADDVGVERVVRCLEKENADQRQCQRNELDLAVQGFAGRRFFGVDVVFRQKRQH